MTVLAHADIVPFLGTLAGAAVLGVAAVRTAAHRGRDVSTARSAALLGAALLTLMAVSPTVDHLAHDRLSWHMTQHLLLTVAAPPLFVLAGTGRLLLTALPITTRRRIAPLHRRVALVVRTRRRLLVVPVTVLAVAVLSGWHLPIAYDAAVDNATVHAAEHATMFGTALAFWWLVLDRRCPATSALVAILTFVVTSGLVGAMLTFAPRPIYAPYAGQDGALADQQLAGLLMWIPGGVPFLLAAVAITVRTLAGDGRDPRVSVASAAAVPR